MPLTPPKDAIYPASKISKVKVLYDGTKAPFHEFSIAELTLKDGTKAIGVRHDRNVWNTTTVERGYPVVRGGRPSWFIMPNMPALLPILNSIFNAGNPAGAALPAASNEDVENAGSSQSDQ